MRGYNIKLFTILLFILCSTKFSYGQYTTRQVDSIVNYALDKFNVAGVALAIVKDGKVVHSKGYGVQSISTKKPVTEHTNFAIASNSKAFTSAALALLVEDGKLSWNDKVRKHIPEFTMYNPYVTENFNIRDLITHRSGLGLGVGDLMIVPDGSDFTMDDILSSFQHFKPTSAFRTKYDYDNLLYLVAGEVIKRVSGKTWEEFVTNRIFEPLNMNNTIAAIDRLKDKSTLATAHDCATGKLIELEDYNKMINGAAAGIYSNVNDLSKWMLVHLNQGKYGDSLNKNLFSIKSQREMWKIHTVTNGNKNPRYNTHFSGYGLGWNLSDIKGNMSVSHTGGLPGMLSKTIMIPDLNLGIVILTNTSDEGAGIFQSVTNTIVDKYLGLDDFGWVDKYAAHFKNRKENGNAVVNKVWEEVKNADVSKLKKENYLGTYKDLWFGEIEIFMNGDKMWFKSQKSPKLNGEMFYYKANTFAIKWEYQDMHADAFATFTLDEEGNGIGIRMKGISPNIDFSFDFHDLDFKRVHSK